MPNPKIRTRFAPSPTGYMHVGNLRTALYTYLMAKHDGGTFILRIEDTDQGRYVEGAVDVIYNTLRETGLLWDEGPDVGGPVGPYVQSERMGMFKQYAEQLVAEGKAYYCFCTEERLEALHAEQRAHGEMTHYDGCCRDLPKEEVEKRLAAGEPYVIRQKIPREGVTGFDDMVYGHIEVNNSEMDDQILIKTDGMPTYNFANVVDDHLMGITHVIRGSEYLSSTPKYNLLYQAFGWDIPNYIHCPPVMKDAQNKLSKRNGDASYQDLVAKGYLTEAILNYICLLGWSPKGEYAEQEIFSLADLVKIWTPDGISKSPAIFDPLKLRAINAEYIRRLSPEEFLAKAEPWIDSAVHTPIDKKLLCANLQPRCEVLGEIPEQLDFFDVMPEYDVSLYANKKQKTTPESAKEALEALLERGEVVEEPVAGEQAVYLHDLCEAEQYVAFRLWELAAGEIVAPHGLEELIDRIQAEQGITYAPQQRQAVELAATSQVMLLTGGPGTGKTTSLRGVLALFDALGLETALAAPTGRAAKRLGELCGAEGTTIHRLLETQYDPHSGRLVFAHDESDPLKADAVIVDETSMVDITLMHGLLSALRPECRLILVGDPDQLPSVGPGNLFSDLIRSGVIPMVRLTEIFRQAAESAIVRSAHGVNRGELPDLRDNKHDFFFLRRKEPARAAETIVELVKTRLPNNMGIPPEQIQVLSPTRKRTAGTASLNRAIQEAVNPPGPDRPERRFGEYIFRRGDRVMQVRNNYDVVWKDGLTSGMGVFNGDIGQVVEVDNRAELLTVDFDGRRVEYTPDMLGELEPAYAITVHKAQGSEYRAVILAVCEGAPMLLTRGVLYTAITRARELLILVGDEDVVAHMTANDRQQRRYSGLRWRLAQLANG